MNTNIWEQGQGNRLVRSVVMPPLRFLDKLGFLVGLIWGLVDVDGNDPSEPQSVRVTAGTVSLTV